MVADLARLSTGRQDYYVREVAENREEYLAGHGESPGRWLGKGAAGLGLGGVASTNEFVAMFEGRDPSSGELLGRPHGKAGVPAWDLVLRPVKDVSVLFALGDRRTASLVQQAHRTAVAAAVNYLDEHVGTRRGHGGHERVAGQGLVAVGFEHRTSRAGDPLLHTHVIIANRVRGADGVWRALDGRDLFRHRLAADAVFRAAYQRELSRTLGVEWSGPDAHGNRQIIGMPDELVQAFSKRAAQVSEAVAELEASGRERSPGVVRWMVRATRQAKQHEPPETLAGRWQAEAASLGVDRRALLDGVCGRSPEIGLDESQVAKVFARLAGPKGLTARASSFGRHDVVRALGAELAAASPAELERLTDRFVAGQARLLSGDVDESLRRWSTPELLDVEERLVTAAIDRTDEGAGRVPAGLIRQALESAPSAGADQQAMVEDVCGDGRGVSVVVGRAGTGKTYAVGVARQAWELAGFRVVGVAPTGIATVSLHAEGFEHTATVDRLLRELHRDSDVLDGRTVLVVDEASMVGSRTLARLLDHTQQAGAKVVLVGDDRQLSAIDAGGGFRALRRRLGASELSVNRRQVEAWERQALDLVRDGLAEEAIGAYQAHERLVAAESKQQLTGRLLTDWWQAHREAEADPGRQVVILAYRRAEVDQLNSCCQQVMASNGRLGSEHLQVGDRRLRVGDQVVCGRNALARLGVANGSRGTVTAIDPHTRALEILLDGPDRQTVRLPGWYLDDRTRAGSRTPAWLRQSRWLTGGRTVDLAYATSGHRAQGLTRYRALVQIAGAEDANWLYVALSRARAETRLYAQVHPEPVAGELDLAPSEPGDVAAQLARGLARDGAEGLAVDTPRRLDLRRRPTRTLRAERDRLAGLLAHAPPDRSRRLEQAAQRREQAETARAEAAEQLTQARQQRDPAQRAFAEATYQLAARDLDKATERQRQARQACQQRAGWLEAHHGLLTDWRQLAAELAWRRRAHAAALEIGPPGWAREHLGPEPESVAGRQAWQHAAAAVVGYRDRYGIEDPDDPLGTEPHGGDLAQRRAWRHARAALDQLHTTRPQPDRSEAARDPAQPDRTAHRRGPERAAG